MEEAPEVATSAKKDEAPVIERRKTTKSVSRRLEAAKRRSEGHAPAPAGDDDVPVVLSTTRRRQKVADRVWVAQPESLFDKPMSKSAEEFQKKRLGTKPRESKKPRLSI